MCELQPPCPHFTPVRCLLSLCFVMSFLPLLPLYFSSSVNPSLLPQPFHFLFPHSTHLLIFFALPLLCSSPQCNTPTFPSHDLPFITSLTLLFSSILMCLHFIFWFLLLSIRLSEDLMAERCEGGTKCFLLSINTVLYACVARSTPPPGRMRGRREMSAEI